MKTHITTIRLTPTMHRILKRIAGPHGSVSSVIRLLLARAIHHSKEVV